MLGSGGHLAADVLDHHLGLDDAEAPVVDRHHRAVAAAVLAASARFRVAHCPPPAAFHLQIGVAGQRRQGLARRHAEALLGVGDRRLGPGLGRRRPVRREPLIEPRHRRLELAAEDGRGAEAAQVILIERRVEAIEAEMRLGVEGLEPGHHGAGQPGRGVHGHVDANQAGRADRPFVEVLYGEVVAGDLGAGLGEPRCRRGQPEGLVPKGRRWKEGRPSSPVTLGPAPETRGECPTPDTDYMPPFPG